MPYPLPPNKAGMLPATKTQDQGRRIAVQEQRTITEPRTYHAENATNVNINLTPYVPFTIPIVWRPGNLISVFFKGDFTYSGTASAQVYMSGSPFGSHNPVPIIAPFVPAALPAVETRATTPASAAGVGVSPFWPYTGAPLILHPINGETVSTGPGTFNLTFTVSNTSGGAGTIGVFNLAAWIMVY